MGIEWSNLTCLKYSTFFHMSLTLLTNKNIWNNIEDDFITLINREFPYLFKHTFTLWQLIRVGRTLLYVFEDLKNKIEVTSNQV